MYSQVAHMLGSHRRPVLTISAVLALILVAAFWPRLKSEYYYQRILADPYSEFNSYYFYSLNELDDAGVPYLLRLLNHELSFIRVYAIESLTETGGDEVVKALITLAQRDDDRSAREAAIKALGEIGDISTLPLLTRLAPYNGAALKALPKLGVEGEQVLLDIYRRHEESGWRAAALRVFCGLPLSSVDVRREVIMGLEDLSYEVRMQSIRCVPEVLGHAAFDYLEPLLKSEDLEIKLEASYQLATMKNLSGFALVSDTLLDESLPRASRARAAYILSQMRDPRGLRVLEKAKESEDSFVRAEASRAESTLKMNLAQTSPR